MTFEMANSWFFILIWFAFFALDNYLTIYVAGLYYSQDPMVIEFEGGYELTPQYKAEVNQLRLFGPQFIRSSIITIVFMSLVWWLVILGWTYPVIYETAVGALILLSCVVNIRHVQNITFFRAEDDDDKPRGHIFYPHGMVYRGSAVAFMSYGVFYLVLAMLGGSWFFVGGVLSCLATGIRHYRLAAINPEGMSP